MHPVRAKRLAGLVALAPLLGAAASLQGERSAGSEPFEIVLRADDEALEGRGPSRTYAHTMRESGELWIWASSTALDPLLRVERVADGALEEREDGGGGRAALLQLPLASGEQVRVTVAASRPGPAGPCLVQIVEVPALDAGPLAALEAAEREIDAAGGDWRARRYAEARARLAAALDAVLALPGPERHAEVERVCARIADIADDGVDEETAVRAWRASLAFRERHYPPDSRQISSARLNLGLELRDLGALDEAAELHERVLATRRRTLEEDDADLLRAMRYLANTYYVAGRYEDALALAQEAVEVTRRTRPPDAPELIDGLRMLTLPLKALERWPEVLELERRIERSFAERLPPDDPSLLQARENLANTLAQMGAFEEARDLLEGVLAARLAALPEDATLVQWARQDLAAVYYKTGERARSMELLEAAYAALAGKYPPDHPEVERARENLIVVYAGSGREREALEMRREVHERLGARLPEGHPDLLRSQANLARSEGDVGNVAEAVRLIDEVLAAREATLEPDHPLLAATLQSAAMLHVEAGDPGRALDLMERCWAILERTLPPGNPKRLNARENLAMVRHAYGDVRGALAELEPVYAQRSRELSPGNHNLLVVQGNMATLLREVGEHDRALELARAALEGAAGQPEGDSLRQALELLLVGLLRVEGRTEEALALVESALERARASYDDDHPLVQKIRTALAEVLLDAGRPADARESVEAALAKVAATHPPSHADRIGLQTLAGQVDVALDEPAAARSAFLEAARALRAHLDEVAATFGPRVHEEVNQLSREVLDGLLSARDPALPAAEQDTESLRFLLAFRGHAERRGRARALVRELAARDEEIARLDAAARDARQRWLDAREGPHASAELLARFRRPMEETADALQRALAPSLRGILEPPRLEEVLERIPDGSRVLLAASHERLEPDSQNGLRRREVCTIFELSRAGVQRIEIDDGERLAALCGSWRGALESRVHAGRGVGLPSEASSGSSGPALELAALLREVLARLPEAPSMLWISPDGPLATVPWGALPLGDGVDLAQRHRLAYLESPAALAPRPGLARGPSLLAAGGIDYGARAEAQPERSAARGSVGVRRGPGTWIELPGSEREIERIAEVFGRGAGPVCLLRGSSATKAAFAARAPEYRYIHVATHAFFAPEADWESRSAGRPMESALERGLLSGVVFAGANREPVEGRDPGVLTAAELAELDLSGCELAVLSACETNVGARWSGEAVTGLNRALHVAGARNTITSLWKIDDLGAEAFFRAFYGALWVDGLSVVEAFSAARERTRAAGFGPAVWAGFVLYASGSDG